jgi:hypothetical protein
MYRESSPEKIVLAYGDCQALHLVKFLNFDRCQFERNSRLFWVHHRNLPFNSAQ